MIVKLQQNHFQTNPAVWSPVTHIFSIPVTCLPWTYVWCSVKGEWFKRESQWVKTLLFLPFFLNPIFLCFESQPNVSMSSPSFLARSVVCKNCCWCAAQNFGSKLIKEFGLYSAILTPHFLINTLWPTEHHTYL